MDSMVVAKLLGHSTSRMVELAYAHLHDPSKIEAVGTLPAMPNFQCPGAESNHRHEDFQT